ncbi:DUF4352 domain-containing protein [Gordonia sp. SID5947]|uniref:DUF4352 domain-containing protein n=1 Tax=Gordonia sp. SID5947 TaxID=2690315 RepID=UPI0013718695|nr:DUF4352 domain-containing protein [Gordonia sp. SID5947]MYR06309.1 DUF4352 domain-containing protein [Gordonia sp. SID5947]
MTNPQNPEQQYAAPQQGAPYSGAPQYAAPQQYPGDHYGAAPQYGAPIPPVQSPKKKRKWPWVMGGIFMLLIIIAAVSGGGSDDATDDTAAAANATAANAPADVPAAANAAADVPTATAPQNDDDAAAMNSPVRDGKFEFVVTGVERGLESVGSNPYLAQKAQGQFVIVAMTVKNIGDRPQGFSPSNQKLLDSQGRSFESDTSAQIALDSDSTDVAVWDNINPGNAVQVRIVYDMPAGAAPATVELHDSMFSGGEKVSLK